MMMLPTAFVVGLVAIACDLAAQTVHPSHPFDPYAIHLSDLTTSCIVVQGSNQSTSCQASARVCVWATVNGKIDVVLDVQSVRLTGDASLIDTTALSEILDHLAAAAIHDGIGFAYVGCFDTVRAVTPSCGDRTGTGMSTRFAPCGTDWCVRGYSIECSGSGGLTLTQGFEGSTECGSVAYGCDAACDSTTEGKTFGW